MKKILTLRQLVIIFVLIIISSCGSDPVEGITDTYQGGEKKVFVRFHPDEFILEKYIYNPVGELIQFERDSLDNKEKFREFMLGAWLVDNMTIDGESVYRQDLVINPETHPNIYNFSSSELKIAGEDYIGDYKIWYRDSTKVEMEGDWEFGIKGEDTYRSSKAVYKLAYFQILSYEKFIWLDFIKDEEKEIVVVFRRFDTSKQVAESR